jgi:predicted transcriptional regulator
METIIIDDTAAIKEELKQKIDLENNPIILKAIQELLFPEESTTAYRESIRSMILAAEEDIKAGRVYTSEEFKAKLDDRLASLK